MKTLTSWNNVSILVSWLVLGWTAPVFATGTAKQEVTLTFYQDSGSGLQQVENPTIGQSIPMADTEALYAFEPGTTFNFSVDTNVQSGDLILMIRETGTHAPFMNPVEPGEPPVVYTAPTVFWSHVIDLSTVSGIQTVTIPTLNAGTLGGDPERVFYFGIYATGGDEIANVSAKFNDMEVGSEFIHIWDHHPALNLPILYLHPDWDPEPAILEDIDRIDYQMFSDLGITFMATQKPVYGAIANLDYRLVDTNPLGATDPLERIWSIYKLDGSALTLLGHFPGGSGTFGFDITPPEPPCDTTFCPVCDDTQRYIVQCQRVDERGAVSTTGIDLNNLGTDTFIYEVGHNLVTLSPPTLRVTVQRTESDYDHYPTPDDVNLNVLYDYPIWVQPWENDYACLSYDVEFKIQSRLANAGAYVESQDWIPIKALTQGSDVQSYFAPIVESPTNPQEWEDAHFPLHVSWKIKTPYGESDWSEELQIRRSEGLEAPNLSVEWPTPSTILAANGDFELSIATQPPANTSGIYHGSYSVWLYDPAAPNDRHVRLENSGSESCQTVTFESGQPPITWQMPEEFPWTVEAQDRLALRVKFIWHPFNDIPECNGVINSLNHFSAIATGGITGAVAGFADSPEYRGVVGTESLVDVDLDVQAPVVYDPSGGVNFRFLVEPSGDSTPVRMRWRWTSGNQVWRDGTWQSSGAPYSEIWPLADSNDVFSNRWQWDFSEGLLRPSNQVGGAPAPFAPDGATNLLQNFFNSNSSVTVEVAVLVDFQDGSQAEDIETLTIRPSQSDTLVSGLNFMAGGKTLSLLHGRVGHVPDLEWTVRTTTNQSNQVRVAVYKENPGSGWSQLYCDTLEDATDLFSNIQPTTGEAGKIYSLEALTNSGLFSLFSTNGAGAYEVRFSGETCSGDWDGALTTAIRLNPTEGFRVQFHYRDHLGSSTVSRVYSPEFDTSNTITSASAFQFEIQGSGNQVLNLYPQKPRTTHFTPFGQPLGDAEEEPDPRYTDHEYDPESGFNYMKGRFQIATYAKFNRPDPMRDWDWENPSSINLYQYVRNNPIQYNDPTGEVLPVVVGFGLWEAAAAAGLVTTGTIFTYKATKTITDKALEKTKEENRQALNQALGLTTDLKTAWTFSGEEAFTKNFSNEIIDGKPLTRIGGESLDDGISFSEDGKGGDKRDVKEGEANNSSEVDLNDLDKARETVEKGQKNQTLDTSQSDLEFHRAIEDAKEAGKPKPKTKKQVVAEIWRAIWNHFK